MNNNTLLAAKIHAAIESVDDCLHVEDLAKVVANILEEHYGEHNYEAFLNTLKNNLQ